VHGLITLQCKWATPILADMERMVLVLMEVVLDLEGGMEEVMEMDMVVAMVVMVVMVVMVADMVVAIMVEHLVGDLITTSKLRLLQQVIIHGQNKQIAATVMIKACCKWSK